MSDDLEKKLHALHLAAPSADLDRRMDKLFEAHLPARRGWWLAAFAAAGAAAAILVLLSRPPALPPGPVRKWSLPSLQLPAFYLRRCQKQRPSARSFCAARPPA